MRDVSEEVFKVGSSSPAAVLLDAVDHLERNSAKADEDIRLIRTQLTEAVDGCIAAAGHEWDPYWQRQLLNVLPLIADAGAELQGGEFWKAFPRAL
jgi:hypothetical protein